MRKLDDLIIATKPGPDKKGSFSRIPTERKPDLPIAPGNKSVRFFGSSEECSGLVDGLAVFEVRTRGIEFITVSRLKAAEAQTVPVQVAQQQ